MPIAITIPRKAYTSSIITSFQGNFVFALVFTTHCAWYWFILVTRVSMISHENIVEIVLMVQVLQFWVSTMFRKSNVSFWVFKVLDNCPSSIMFHGFYFGCSRWCSLLCGIFRLGWGTVDCYILMTGDSIWSRGTSQNILSNSFWPCSKKCKNVYCSTTCTNTLGLQVPPCVRVMCRGEGELFIESDRPLTRVSN